jgi:hypothetical protein
VTTYTGADNSGIDGVNNSGMKLVKGTVDCLSFSYNEPLFFEKECRVEVSTGSDAGIVQMIASLVIGKGCEYPS